MAVITSYSTLTRSEWTSLEELYDEYPTRSGASTPKYISREGSNFVFGPVAADGTLKGIYYAKQDPLRTTDPSWYVTNAPEVLLYGSLLEATPFIWDDARIPVWQSMYDRSVSTLLVEQGNSEVSQGRLIQRAS